jgi:dihydroorotate dehydrogenase (NAD+) catalytic subunit
MIDLSVKVGSVQLKNPIMPASGTFGEELADVIDFNELGAMVTKTFTKDLRAGNALPRICEVKSGMLNAIGIPSKGWEDYVNNTVPFYRQYNSPLVASISANTAAEFAELVGLLDHVPEIIAIEANMSCPNIEANGKAFAIEAGSAGNVMKALRAATAKPIWAKLTPNTSDVISVAQAIEAEGGDALVVGNTLLGMSIDLNTRKPRLGNRMGGFSGPAIKPVMVRMVYQCYKNTKLPIIGCGGISTAEDVIEFFYAGASAVQVGTATFIDPTAMITIRDNLLRYCEEHGIQKLSELTGIVLDDPLPAYTALS